ncbi:negative transcriptional regulator [Altererythrobacter sp. B11]|uniref:FMN-binding negative transcriptional regulator n=1 Tax=Altererythrobacter sp. B11 TaxID=2060312 RepID=UPI000DC70AC1|nr:FMN-binding negative transcriptional regulator [Altererythrobacter sp. B11]BBC74198.1 negative transcriptional regulator [Altererythrobacter sp. B11]
MHPAAAFHTPDRALHEMLIEQIGFGMVFAATPAGPRVAHTPLVSTGDGAVQFHLSNRNALTPHLEGGTALLLVNGPDAYVSPRWYEDARTVPTWNYIALEMEGRVRRMAPEGLAGLLGTIGAREEARLGGDQPWRPEDVPAQQWDALFRGITGFEMEVAEWRPTFKLSQNKPAEDRERVADALENGGGSGIAQLMRSLGARDAS